MAEFVHLHNHSTVGSVLDGYSFVSEYLDRAAELEQRGMGLTDHGSVCALYQFIHETRARGMTPVPGCEFYVAPRHPEGARHIGPVFYGQPDGSSPYDVSRRGAYLHMTVWAYNTVGLHNLFALSTASNSHERFYTKPRIDTDLLAEHAEGLIAATGCPSSEVSTRFLLGQDNKAYEYAGMLRDMFGENLYVEIMDHHMGKDLERQLLPKQLKLAHDMGLPLLATNDCHYALQENAFPHEEMLCAQSGAFMSDKTYEEGGRRFAFSGDEYYLKSAEEMAAMFPPRDFPGALSNTLRIAEQASEVDLPFNPHLKPKPILPDGYDSDMARYKDLIREGFERRYGDAPPEVREEAIRRNKKEFDVIGSSDFIGYMLVVRDYLTWTKEHYSTVTPDGATVAYPVGVGRGSAGGSIHAYELGITEIDPIKYDLLFERFLGPGRGATCLITYDDGTQERHVVSDVEHVVTDDGVQPRYVHQLSVGDVVQVDDDDGTMNPGDVDTVNSR